MLHTVQHNSRHGYLTIIDFTASLSVNHLRQHIPLGLRVGALIGSPAGGRNFCSRVTACFAAARRYF